MVRTLFVKALSLCIPIIANIANGREHGKHTEKPGSMGDPGKNKEPP
jgi:hypothetical protein